MQKESLTVRLLVARSGTRSTKFLGLATAWVCHKQGTVVLDKDVTDLSFGNLIHNYKIQQTLNC